MAYTLSYSGVDQFLYDVFAHAWKISGEERKAEVACGAIKWYIATGRASSDFLRAMLSSDPRHIAKLSLQGGSDDEILARIKTYLKRRSARTA